MTTIKARSWTVWLLSSGLAVLCATIGAREAGAQQASAVSVSARVMSLDPVPSAETLSGLIGGLPNEVPGAAQRGTGATVRSRSAPLRAGFSQVSATRECPRRGTEGCLAVVTVQFLEN
jgi:hypothetical protein